MWCLEFEGDAGAVDGDREGEELTAILLGRSESHQLTERCRRPECRSQPSVDGFAVFDVFEEALPFVEPAASGSSPICS